MQDQGLGFRKQECRFNGSGIGNPLEITGSSISSHRRGLGLKLGVAAGYVTPIYESLTAARDRTRRSLDRICSSGEVIEVRL